MNLPEDSEWWGSGGRILGPDGKVLAEHRERPPIGFAPRP